MKSFITIVAALVITASAFAAPNFSRLTIINVENKNLRVVIDGNKYDGIGNNLSLGNLNVGYHSIKIYQIRHGFFSDYKLIYSSSVFLKPDRQINMVINRGGDVAINEQFLRGDNRFPDNRGGNDRGQRDDRNDNRDNHGRNDRDDRRDYGYNKY